MRRDPNETNSTVDDRERRTKLKCSRCKPHKGENATHKRRGKQKRRSKNKRRK